MDSDVDWISDWVCDQHALYHDTLENREISVDDVLRQIQVELNKNKVPQDYPRVILDFIVGFFTDTTPHSA